jgi:hypothetical protein
MAYQRYAHRHCLSLPVMYREALEEYIDRKHQEEFRLKKLSEKGGDYI